VRIAPLLVEELLFEYAELGLRWFAPLSPLRRRSVARQEAVLAVARCSAATSRPAGVAASRVRDHRTENSAGATRWP